MRFTSLTLGIAAISLLLLLLFFVLACGRFPARTSLPTVAISANKTTPVDTISAAASDSTRQTVATVVQLAASTITSTANSTTLNSVPETWQHFSSKAAGYSLFHPPNSTITSLSLLPSTIEHTRITLPPVNNAPLSTVTIRVYKNTSGISLHAFLSELNERMYGETISASSLENLMSSPLEVAGVQSYKMDFILGSTELQIIVPHKNYFYMFILGHEFGPFNSSAEDIERFRRIIDTVQFN